MKKYLFLSIVFFVSFHVRAQGDKTFSIPDLSAYKTSKEKLRRLFLFSDSLNQAGDYPLEIRKIAGYALTLHVPGQDSMLSLFNLYIGHSYLDESDDSAKKYLEAGLYYGEKSGSKTYIVRALRELMYFYNNTSGYVARRDATAARLIYIVDTAKNEQIKEGLYFDLAEYYAKIGQHEKEVEYYLRSLTTKQTLLRNGAFDGIDSVNLGGAYIRIGAAFLSLYQPDKSIEYTKLSREYIAGYESGMPHFFKNLIYAYLQKKDTHTAGKYYDSLTQYILAHTQSPDQWLIRVDADLTFADYYLNLKQPESAQPYLARAQGLIAEYPDDILTNADVHYMAGVAFMALKKYDEALPLLQSAVVEGLALNRYADILKSTAECYEGLGKYQEAVQYYKQYVPLRDSLYDEMSRQSLANAEARYQNKDKQQQIEAQNMQLAYARKQRLWLVAGLSLSCLVALLLVVIYRNKKRTADMLNQKNERLAQLNDALEEANHTKAKLFGIISHDLRSPISQVYQFLKLQQLDPDRLNEEQRNKLSNKIQTATGSLLETMEDLLLWSKTQMNQFNTDMQPVALQEVVAECLQLLQLNSEAKDLHVENNIPSETTVVSDPYFLQTIVRNLLQNAIKASPPQGIIRIDFSGEKLSVVNQGGHFSQQAYERALASKETERSLSGLGLRLVDELSHKIKVQVIFADTDGHSTCVQMLFR